MTRQWVHGRTSGCILNHTHKRNVFVFILNYTAPFMVSANPALRCKIGCTNHLRRWTTAFPGRQFLLYHQYSITKILSSRFLLIIASGAGVFMPAANVQQQEGLHKFVSIIYWVLVYLLIIMFVANNLTPNHLSLTFRCWINTFYQKS